MEGMNDIFVSQIYSNIALNEEITKKADLDYTNKYYRKENLTVEHRTQIPEPVNAIRALLQQLVEDKRSDSTGTYTELKKMAAYFINNYDEFDNEMEIKAIAALHARACDYYNLHSSRPRRTSLGKNRLRISTSIMTQLQNLIDSFDEEKKNLAMTELCRFEAPKPLYEGEKEYKTDVSANSKPLNEYFARYAAKAFLETEEKIANPTDDQIAAVIKQAPYLNSKTAAHLLRTEMGIYHYRNLEKLLPEGETMDTYMNNSLYPGEARRIVQIICPKFSVDNNGNPLRPEDAVNMQKAQKNMEIMASGDPGRMHSIIDDFVQSLCDTKVPDIIKITKNGLDFKEYALKHLDELRDYTNLFTCMENLITRVPEMKAYYEAAYTEDFREQIHRKGEIIPFLAEELNLAATEYGLMAFHTNDKSMIHYNAYNMFVDARKSATAPNNFDIMVENMERLGGAGWLNRKMDARYDRSLAKYGEKEVIFIEPYQEFHPMADELVVSYGICQEPHREFAKEVMGPFMDASTVNILVNENTAVLEKTIEGFTKKRCIFRGKYPVPNIAECERILKNGSDEEKIALELCLINRLKVLPVTIKDDPFGKAMQGEEYSDNYKRLMDFKNRLDLAVFGDVIKFYKSDRRNFISEDDDKYIEPSREMGIKALRMFSSYLMVKNLERAKFLREEVEKTGKAVNKLSGKEKGIILLKSIDAGVDAALMTAIESVGEFFGITANVVPMFNFYLQSQDMFKDDFELLQKFGDGGNNLGVAHSFIMGKVPKGATDQMKKQLDEETTAQMEPYVGDYILKVRDEYRKAGMYCMPFTNELINMFNLAVEITDFTDKHNDGREDTFYKLVVEPLGNVLKLSPLTDNNRRQEGYPQSLNILVGKLADYKEKHNPHSDIGKKRLEYVDKLIEMLRNGIEANRAFELNE